MISDGDTLLGRYRVGKKLGEGGMAVVYQATSLAMGGFARPVVIKAIRRELATQQGLVHQFVNEASVGAGLHHPGIVQVYDLGEQESTFFMVLEHVAGVDLGGLIRELRRDRRALGQGMVAYIGHCLCEALECAHGHLDKEGNPAPVIHRDISPPNILISFEGAVKLADFGIARVLGSARLTQPGTLKGKHGYMSPEQTYGRDVDGRSDLFSLGIVLWEAATGRRLFRGKKASEKLLQVRAAEVPSLAKIAPHIDPRLCDIVHKALAREPADRFQSSRQMSEALEEVFEMDQREGAAVLSGVLAQCFPGAQQTQATADPILSTHYEYELLEEPIDQSATVVDLENPFEQLQRDAGSHTVVLFNIPREVPSQSSAVPRSRPSEPPGLEDVPDLDKTLPTPLPIPATQIEMKALGAPATPLRLQKLSAQGTLVGSPLPRKAPLPTPRPRPLHTNTPLPFRPPPERPANRPPPKQRSRQSARGGGGRPVKSDRARLLVSLLIGLPLSVILGLLVFYLVTLATGE